MLKLPNSIEPAVMAENIVHLRDAEASLDGRVSDLEVTAPKDYSTTETATGQKWIDGKEIYCKVITGTFPEISTTSSQEVGELEFNEIISITSILERGDDFKYINYFQSYWISIAGSKKIYLNNVNVYCSEKPYKIIVEYTKPDPTPGRAPEDEPEEVKEPEENKTTKKKTTK